MRPLKISNSITNRDSVSLEKYFNEIEKIKLLPPDEEVQLADLIQKGNKTALDKLVKANLRFVVSVAKKYQGQGLPLSDLINEGNIGLIRAAENFDATRGFKFISYAIWHIRQCIVYALASNARIIRMPINKVAMSKRISDTSNLLEQKLQRQPSAEELAEAMEMEAELINEYIGSKTLCVSLDTPLNAENEDGSMLDVLENNNAEKTDAELIYNDSLKIDLTRFLCVLNERKKEVICYFFGIDTDNAMSLDDIARKFQVTPERVRQIKDKAISKLKETHNFESLRGYLAA
jgi:RNA polymerase primary sigma factor